MHSPDHSTKGTPSALSPATGQWPLTAGEYVVSGSLSSPSRGAFHLSLTVLVHYRSHELFSLGGWSPQLPTGFHVPRGTQDPHTRACACPTGLSPSLMLRSNSFGSRALGLLWVLQPRPGVATRL